MDVTCVCAHVLKMVQCLPGGLNFQVEHHLFPGLPRHNLGKVQRRVRDLCSKHGLHYEICSMGESTQRVIQCLADIGRLA